MNLLSNHLADAQKVWNQVRSVKDPRAAAQAGSTPQAPDKDKESGDSAVFSFITPSIIGEYTSLHVAPYV
jgi:hypothetical protein